MNSKLSTPLKFRILLKIVHNLRLQFIKLLGKRNARQLLFCKNKLNYSLENFNKVKNS